MRNRFRRVAVTLALGAMLLRALLPTGWMPNPAGFATSPLIICLMDMPSAAAQAMDMSMSGMDMHAHGGSHDHGTQQNNETCPFAAAPHIAAPIAIADLAPPSTLSHFVVHEAAGHSIIGTGRYQPQSPRAPPEIA